MLYLKAIGYALIQKYYDFRIACENWTAAFRFWAEDTVIFHEQGAEAMIAQQRERWKELPDEDELTKLPATIDVTSTAEGEVTISTV